MKNLISSTFFHPFFVGLVCCLSLLGGCQKSEIGEKPKNIPLTEVPTNPNYATLPLVGTKWKLVGFVDQTTNNVKSVQSSAADNYTLAFESNGDFAGISSTNTIMGVFSFDVSDSIMKVEKLGGTKINETPYGKQYMSLLRSTIKYEITEIGLKLHNESTIYLLYSPIENF
ncbi:hypothetical protein [Parapedobacter sp.]